MPPLVAVAIGVGVSAAAGVAGTIVSGVQGAEQNAIDRQETVLGMKNELSTLRGEAAKNEVKILETENKITDYEQFLGRFPAYEQYQKDKAVEQGKQQFGQLMGNFEMANIMAAAKGQKTAGTSAGQVIGQKQERLEAFAGSDLAFNTEGDGLFAQGYQDLVMDLNVQKDQAERQLGVYEQSLETLEEAQTGYESSIEDYEDTLAEWGVAPDDLPDLGDVAAQTAGIDKS